MSIQILHQKIGKMIPLLYFSSEVEMFEDIKAGSSEEKPYFYEKSVNLKLNKSNPKFEIEYPLFFNLIKNNPFNIFIQNYNTDNKSFSKKTINICILVISSIGYFYESGSFNGWPTSILENNKLIFCRSGIDYHIRLPNGKLNVAANTFKYKIKISHSDRLIFKQRKLFNMLNQLFYGETKVLNIFNTNIYIHNSFFVLILILILEIIIAPEKALYNSVLIICIQLSILTHEFGHLLTAKKLKLETGPILLTPLGGIAFIENNLTKEKIQKLGQSTFAYYESIIAIAGPIVSFGIAIICFIVDICIYNSYFLEDLGQKNMLIGLFNLLPIFPLDGGRILRSLVTQNQYQDRIKLINTIGWLTLASVTLYFIYNFHIGVLFLLFFLLFIHSSEIRKDVSLKFT